MIFNSSGDDVQIRLEHGSLFWIFNFFFLLFYKVNKINKIKYQAGIHMNTYGKVCGIEVFLSHVSK